MTDVIKNKYEHCCVSHKHPQMDDINQAEQMTFPKRLVNKNIQQNILIRLTTEAMVSPVKTSHLSRYAPPTAPTMKSSEKTHHMPKRATQNSSNKLKTLQLLVQLKWTDRMSNRTRQKNQRRDIHEKWDQRDSPEIPDRGETSEISGLPSGVQSYNYQRINVLLHSRYKQ